MHQNTVAPLRPRPFVWLAQSAYSFLQGASQPSELLLAALRQQAQGLCLSDFDGVYGLARFHIFSRSDHFKEHINNEEASGPPRCFFGAQVRLPLGRPEGTPAPTGCDLLSLEAPAFLQPRLCLIAESLKGYGALCRLLDHTHRNGKAAEPLCLDDPTLPWPTEDVTALLPMRGWSALCSHHNSQTNGNGFARWCDDLLRFQELWQKHTHSVSECPSNSRFYLAVTPPTQALEHLSLQAHLKAHDELGIPLLATEDVFFATPRCKEKHDLLQSIRLNTPLQEISPWACFPNTERHLQSAHNLWSFCERDPRLQQALVHNFSLAERMSFSPDELSYRYPKEFVPDSMSAQDYLEQLTWAKATKRYPQGIPANVKQLLQKELGLVKTLGFADYFLTVWDIVTFARSQHILCQGRGSAANSVICYMLEITAVDPTQHDVLFERFISVERGEPPDIDVDFEHERREEVIQYIYSRYGRARAAMVANVVSFRRQGALRATGKALGIPLQKVDALLKGMQDRFQRGRSTQDILEQKQKEKKELLVDEALFSRWLALAKQIEGLPRHLGIHSGGFVISHNPLNQLVPTEPATMEDRTVIQWCKEDLEGLGLFKIDVLSLGMLTALRKTLEALHEHKKGLPEEPQKAVNLASIPIGCSKAYDMICAGKTMGTFQIESRAQMSIIPRLQPRNFYDLVIQIGIIRPGPIVAGTVTRYVSRRVGAEPIHFPDPRLRPILERTLGVPVFQEQVMRIAMSVGDFSPGEADELRRCMGAWKMNGTIYKFEEKLRAGMKRNGIPPAFANEIYKQIEGFSEYGFPESHAISFAHLAYASAWLKAHFPAYFLLGLLNAQPLGFYSTHSLIQEARREGVVVQPPCLLASNWDHTISPQGEVRLGLRLVKGLSEKPCQDFCEARKQWHSHLSSNKSSLSLLKREQLEETFESFLHLMHDFFDSATSAQLIVGGLLRAFSHDRRMLLWHHLGLPGRLRHDLTLRNFSQPTHSLKDAEENWFDEFSDMRDDTRVLGTSLGKHPMWYIKRWLWPFTHCPTTRLHTASSLQKNSRPGDCVCVSGLVNIKQAPPTAKGMVFVTLEDETGLMNLTFTPQKAEAYREILTHSSAGLLCVQAWVQGADFGHSLKVKHVFEPSHPESRPLRQRPQRKTTLHSTSTTPATK